MSKDDYQHAVEMQKLVRGMKASITPVRPFGDANERCKTCGGPIETLLDSKGKNPLRMCWKCDA